MLTDAVEILAMSSILCVGSELQLRDLTVVRGPYAEAMTGSAKAKVFVFPKQFVDLKRQFGVHIARGREREGLSAVELARLAGITPRQLTRIEQGKQMPRPDTQRRLIQVLRLDMSELSKRPQDMTRSRRGRPRKPLL